MYLCSIKLFIAMKHNLYLNELLTKGAILGCVMLCSHVFEQCAIVYGGTMGWYSVMGFEYIAAAVLFVWMLYRFAKNYSLQVMESRQTIKMFSYGAGWGYVVSVSTLAGIIVGLGRYILHSVVIGHKEYIDAMITSLQAILKANPETASMMDMYNQMLLQLSTQPEPTIFATIFSSVWGYMMWGALVGLVIAAMVKKEPDLFEKQNGEE